MAIDFSKRQIFTTDDGSSSLQLQEVAEQYHSTHGAYNESMHIYIQAGLRCQTELPALAVLECGFGTGLNAALTLLHAGECAINYTAVEAYPLTLEEVQQLHYEKVVPNFPTEAHRQMHAIGSGERVALTPLFHFQKMVNKLEEVALEAEKYDVIYYDMFNPAVQPELWTVEVFARLFTALKCGGVLVTYCAKGSVKRALKAAGFQLESLPGPVGKREITRARKVSA